MFTIVSVVTICHHTMLLQSYWLYSLCCTAVLFILMTSLIAGSFYLLIPLAYFTHPPSHPPSGNHQFFVFTSFCFDLFVWFCFFTGETSIFVFCLTDLFHLPDTLWPIHLSQMARFHSFYVWILIHCIYIHHIFFISLSVSRLLGCFPVLSVVNNAAINIGVHVSFWGSVFVFFG